MHCVALALLAAQALALNNGAARIPPRGYTTWQDLNFNVSDAKLRGIADDMVSMGLLAAGYDILWLDDGWPTCAEWEGANGTSKCKVPAPRDASGRIVPDAAKFPQGLPATFAYIHSKGLRTGIYTAPHAATCGGYSGSLNNEAVDAAAFAEWGVDAVKLDAGCQEDCSLHDGCLLASLTRMRDGLNATGRVMLYYVDDGNPSSGPRVVNPFQRGYPDDKFTQTHIARSWQEQVINWGPDMANMYKLWFDREDNWRSLQDNVHQQANMAWFQASGAFLAPDQMTVAQGQMSAGEYRAELALYAALSAPMFLSARLANFDAETLALVTNPELLAVNADADCVMASPVRSATYTGGDRWAIDTWVKPLSDGSFVWVLVNRDPAAPHDATIVWGDADDEDGTDLDIFPAVMTRGRVRDVLARADVGTFDLQWTATVPPHDARMLRVYPA